MGNSTMIKRVSLFIVLLVIISMTAVMTIQPAQAKSRYYLPSKITYCKIKSGKLVKSEAYALTYNKKGHVIATKRSATSTSKLKYAYYKSGRLKKITCPGGEFFAFDSNGRMTKYWSGESTDRTYYSGKRLTKCREDLDWFKFKYSYYPNGKVKGIAERYRINPDDMIPEYKITLNKKGFIAKESSNGGSTYTLTYSYDKKGRVKAVTKSIGSKRMGKYYFSYKKARTTTSKSKYTAVVNAYVYPYGPQSMMVAVGGGYAAALQF